MQFPPHNLLKIFFTIALSVFTLPSIAHAACTNPAGVAGEILYNAVVDKPQYCDGTNWMEMIKTYNTPSCSGPSDCPNIGNMCGDGAVFAGCHPVTFNRLFVHPNDQSTGVAWSTESVATSALDDGNGKTNQDWIKANKTITSYPAFKLCDDLNIANTLGHNDWYLPSRIEMHYLWYMRDYIDDNGGIAFSSSKRYWTSTTSSNTNSWIVHFQAGVSYGDTYTAAKTTATYNARCMRRNQ